MAKTKAVFTDELGDIDDLIPSTLSNPAAPAPSGASQSLGSLPLDPSEASELEPAPRPELASRPEPTHAGAAPGGKTPIEVSPSVPTAQVDPAVHRKLVQLTAKERARNPKTARSFAEVVLDAVEKHQDALSQFWRQPAPAESSGLFRRQKVTTSTKRRRRHDEPPARIPLGGINPDDLATLEHLWVEWNAGSRSALVEQALRLEFRMKAEPD